MPDEHLDAVGTQRRCQQGGGGVIGLGEPREWQSRGHERRFRDQHHHPGTRHRQDLVVADLRDHSEGAWREKRAAGHQLVTVGDAGAGQPHVEVHRRLGRELHFVVDGQAVRQRHHRVGTLGEGRAGGHEDSGARCQRRVPVAAGLDLVDDRKDDRTLPAGPDQVGGPHRVAIERCGGEGGQVDVGDDRLTQGEAGGVQQVDPERTQGLDVAEQVLPVVLKAAQARPRGGRGVLEVGELGSEGGGEDVILGAVQEGHAPTISQCQPGPAKASRAPPHRSNRPSPLCAPGSGPHAPPVPPIRQAMMPAPFGRSERAPACPWWRPTRPSQENRRPLI